MSFEDWIKAADRVAAQAVSNDCECGVKITYPKIDTTYMHTSYCPLYKDLKTAPDTFQKPRGNQR